MRKGALFLDALMVLLLAVSCAMPGAVELSVQCYLENSSDTVEIRLSAPHQDEVVYKYHSEDGEPFVSHSFALGVKEGDWTIRGTAWLDGKPSGYARKVMLPFSGYEKPEVVINFYEPGWLEEDEI